MIERRKFIRLQAPIGLTYRKAGSQKRDRATLISLLKNIGGGGVRFIAREDLAEGDILDLEIEIPNTEHAIKAEGEVVWFSHTQEKDRDVREAGIRFQSIHPKDLQRILDYVHTTGIR